MWHHDPRALLQMLLLSSWHSPATTGSIYQTLHFSGSCVFYQTAHSSKLTNQQYSFHLHVRVHSSLYAWQFLPASQAHKTEKVLELQGSSARKKLL